MIKIFSLTYYFHYQNNKLSTFLHSGFATFSVCDEANCTNLAFLLQSFIRDLLFWHGIFFFFFAFLHFVPFLTKPINFVALFFLHYFKTVIIQWAFWSLWNFVDFLKTPISLWIFRSYHNKIMLYQKSQFWGRDLLEKYGMHVSWPHIHALERATPCLNS